MVGVGSGVDWGLGGVGRGVVSNWVAALDRLGRNGGRDRVTAGRAGNSAGGNDGAALLGDTELSRVLVLASNIVDQLDAIAGGASGGLKVGSGSPGEAAAVGNTLSKSRAELNNVGGGALEEKDGNGVGGSWLPGDGEGLASRDNLHLDC